MFFELFKILAVDFNFTYDLKWSPDGTHGLILEHGNFSGLIGTLERNEVNLSIGALIITPPRRKVS